MLWVSSCGEARRGLDGAARDRLCRHAQRRGGDRVARRPEDPVYEADRHWGSADDPWGSDFLRPSLMLADAWLLPSRALFAAPAGLLLSAAEMPPSRQGRDATASTGRNHFFEGTSMALADAIEDADHRFVAFNARPPALDALSVWDQARPFEPVALVSMPDLLHPTPPEALTVPPALPDELCFAPQCSRGQAERTANAFDWPRLHALLAAT
mgnify:CR=1 FL=1